MKVIEVRISDELAKQLEPYEEQITEILKLGLERQAEQEQLARQERRPRIYQALANTEGITLPQHRDSDRRRPLPAPITGEPLSEMIIKDRGPRD